MSITVTATPTGASGALLRVLVLTGATASGGKTAHAAPTGSTISVTPNGSNSFIVWSIDDRNSATSMTAFTNNTLLDNISPSGARLGSGYYSGSVTSGSAVTCGVTNVDGSSGYLTAAYEILASGGSTPSLDGSSPAAVSETTGSAALTTASFSPPSGAVVVAIVNGSSFPSAWSVSDSSSMTWTKEVDSTDGQQVWTATTASGTSVSGAVATAALAAPAGSVSAGATVSGAVATAALAAPAGSVSAGATVSGALAALALAAPAGTPSVAVPGATPGLALAAPAGSVSAGATVSGAVAAMALAAPAGSGGGNQSVSGAVARLVFAAPAGVAAAAAVFPLAPLGLRYELLVNGTWTDISTYIYERDDQVVTRGHPDESTTTSPSAMTLTLDNRDGRFSSRNPLGAYYPYIGRNTPVRASVPEGATYLRLEDDAASYAQCPDSAGVSVTGDTEIHVDVTLDNWRADQVLAAKWAQTSNERSWLLTLNESGTLALRWSPDGTKTNSVVAVSALAAPWPGLRRQAVKVTLAVASGTVTFYTAPAAVGQVTLGPITSGWVQLGSAVVVGADSVYDSTAPVQAGWAADAAEYGAYAGVQGKVHAFTLVSGIGGTVKASPDFTAQTAGTGSFADGQSNTWTMEGTSEVSDRKYRAYMEASGWPQNWDPTGSDVWVSLAAGGILRRLTQSAGTRPLQSAFRRALPGAISLDGYWACEDGNDQTGSGATPAKPQQFASAIPGVNAGTFTTATPNFASDSTFLCSYPLPTLNGSRWHFRLPGRGTADAANIFRFLCHVPSTGDTDGGTLARMYTTGTVQQVDLVYNTGGTLRLLGYDWTASGTPIFDTGTVAFAVNGEALQVSIELQTSGSDVQYSVVTLQPGASTGLAETGTVTGTVGNATQLVINALNHTGGENMSGTAIGHVTYQSAWESLFSFGAQLDAWIGEAAGQRFSRLCAEEGIPFRAAGSLDDTVLMGAQTPLALTDLWQECVDADRGTMFEPRQALALGYRTRASMQNQLPAVTIDYSATELGGTGQQMTTTEDDQYTVNDAIVVNSYTGGSGEAQVTEGALSVQAPPDGVGDYQQSPQINLAYDSQCTDLAGWITWLGTVSDPRYPVLPLNLARPALASLYYDAQDADIGDRLVVVNTPAWLPPDGITQIMQGTTETLNSFKFEVDWQGVPELPYETGLVNDTVYGRVDTDGSELHADITSTATSIEVDSTALPVFYWTTASGDWPFDIAAGGERMTVTAVSGTSNPQTFTVTRSVNGVVKAHSAGEDVRLFYPTIVSL